MNRNLPTENLMLQARLQMREALHTDTIAEYADAMRSGADFPPVRVIEAEEGWLVCDGFHRVMAAREASIPSLLCHVTPGTADDALLIALVANCTNGLRRSNADKRRAVIRRALRDYAAATLRETISGYRNSPHHCGQNDRATVYDALELFLRDAQHVDAGLRFADNQPRNDLSALTRRNVAALADWVPPEMRNAAS